MNKLVAILSFSSRKNGNCAAISAHISNGFDDCIQVEINRENIPACGSCDYECLNPELCCPQLTEEYKKLMETLCRSDLEKALKMPCGSKPTTNRRKPVSEITEKRKTQYGRSLLESDAAKADLDDFLSRTACEPVI